MDAWDALFSDTTKVTGTITEKDTSGVVKTLKLKHGPTSMAAEHFADAAVKGATASEKWQSDDKDRTRSRSRKDISGAAARSAALRILGLSPAAPKPAPDPVPEPVKQRGRRGVGAAPSENGTHAPEAPKPE